MPLSPVCHAQDRDDVIETALASAHLPFILNWNLAAKWRGQSCVDGSLLYILTRWGRDTIGLLSAAVRCEAREHRLLLPVCPVFLRDISCQHTGSAS